MVVNDRRISGEHASLRWTGEAWQLRDMGSRNGTFVAGRRLDSGERVQLVEGSTFSLGGLDTTWTLVDASPPGPAARAQDTGEWCMGEVSLLVLPDPDTALLTVYQDRQGSWLIDTPEDTRPACSGQAVTVGDRVWVLELPLSLPPTLADELGSAPALETIELVFRVSRDEEHVEIRYVHRGKVTPMPVRVYHYMLLTLARLRVRDQEQGFAEAERGWVDREELCRMLAMDYPKLNVDIYRARREFAAAGLQGGAAIVERRQGSPQVRLGAGHIRIEPL
jgi:hypothetical protein